jgi:hypothetical protein
MCWESIGSALLKQNLPAVITILSCFGNKQITRSCFYLMFHYSKFVYLKKVAFSKFFLPEAPPRLHGRRLDYAAADLSQM